ncbi:protein farnesyltransferase/geranylgeranyltransferase type-1 subunit alpha-like [Penaeus japonicus]|uniref:protein farnesyltransferase/geranylgeranyltransferase type-1 subunit alpha-like n=1 Tax=Penaeus japonicus TaxID=27405 RepID=UPI001C7152FB|nr:protein farnesyltransferase/geranylgeranyltransferase type-1 subunit alpha-like [Penaeus japonicus]XP_042879193.1 protein farnesyltransferase/geranylgeranyltransferase type-1 subunit alpha-like [Penaeus japonicus]XP_042879194.1 protein farnesyltransferase/geranylgeranyltransferase type-1 subunit alpha-like [Penaeus japonicus]
MGSNDDEYPAEEEAWVFYKDREEWADVTPVPQDDGPNPVVKIAYTDAFTDVYDYFRAVMASGELSERALELTEDALNMNAANYTVWQYRRKILKHLGNDLEDELNFCRHMIELNPKNYQVWHHRRVIVEWLGDASKELRLTEIIFSQDAKNYHAWEHRQWVLRTFKLFDGELDYVDRLLEEDARNNSAWNQRHFTITQTTGFTPDVIEREVKYAKKAISKVIGNESPWSYLRGVLQHCDSGLGSVCDLEQWCQQMYESGERSPHLLTFMLDLMEDKMERETSERESTLKKSLDMCEALAVEHDQIRREYWRYIARNLSHRFGA